MYQLKQYKRTAEGFENCVCGHAQKHAASSRHHVIMHLGNSLVLSIRVWPKHSPETPRVFTKWFWWTYEIYAISASLSWFMLVDIGLGVKCPHSNPQMEA